MCWKLDSHYKTKKNFFVIYFFFFVIVKKKTLSGKKKKSNKKKKMSHSHFSKREWEFFDGSDDDHDTWAGDMAKKKKTNKPPKVEEYDEEVVRTVTQEGKKPVTIEEDIHTVRTTPALKNKRGGIKKKPTTKKKTSASKKKTIKKPIKKTSKKPIRKSTKKKKTQNRPFVAGTFSTSSIIKLARDAASGVNGRVPNTIEFVDYMRKLLFKSLSKQWVDQLVSVAKKSGRVTIMRRDVELLLELARNQERVKNQEVFLSVKAFRNLTNEQLKRHGSDEDDAFRFSLAGRELYKSFFEERVQHYLAAAIQGLEGETRTLTIGAMKAYMRSV